jgi:hypothetical protein
MQIVENAYCPQRKVEQQSRMLTCNQYVGTEFLYCRHKGITLGQMKSPNVSQFTKRHFSLGVELNWSQFIA